MKLRKLAIVAAVSLLLFGAFKGCQRWFYGPPVPRPEYPIQSPDGRRLALVAVEPNYWGFGVISVTFEPPKQQRGDVWGEIQVLYHAKLGWVDNATFAIIGDEIEYQRRLGGEGSTDLGFRAPVRLVTCVRTKEDCSALEARLKRGTKYLVNFQSGMATLGENTGGKIVILTDLPPTPPS